MKKKKQQNDFERLLDDVYESMRKRICNIKQENPDNDEQLTYFDYDFSYRAIQKRKKITLKYLKQAKTELSQGMNADEFQKRFAATNGLIMRGGYNEIDNNHYITTAAAIWILDQLSLQNEIETLYEIIYEYIGNVSCVSDELYYPYVFHPIYDSYLILLLTTLISHRDDDLVADGGIHGSLLNERNPGFKKKAESSSVRVAFDKIINLIDKDVISKSVKRYKEKVWEFYRITFEIAGRISNKIEELIAERDKIDEQIRQRTFDNKVLTFNEALSGSFDDLLERKQLIENEIWDLEDKISFTGMSLANDREKTADSLKELIPFELRKKLKRFSVDDPFESSFALLYLLDTESDIPWLYYGSISVAYTTYDQLPFDAKELNAPNKDKLPDEMIKMLYSHQYHGDRFSNMSDSNGEPAYRTIDTNLSQILYQNGNLVFPRIADITGIERFIALASPTSKEETSALKFLIGGLSAVGFRETGLMEWIHQQPDEEDEEEVNAFSEQDYQELHKENARLKRTINELRSQLYSSDSKVRNLEQEITALTDEKESYRQEISELRNLVFVRMDNDYSEEIKEEVIDFPYPTKRKIVVFGGHTSWRNSIKQLLPDVTFVPAEKIPDEQMIRNADIVWLQTNCLSHASYYKIINIIRTTKKELKIFKHSSSKKCAAELIEYEKQLDE